MPSRPLKPNPQEGHIYGPSHTPDPPKDYSMFSAPSSELAWMAPPLTSGWAPHPIHLPPSLLKTVQAPPKKARMRVGSGLSAPSSPSRLGNISATTPFIGNLIESLCPLFESGTIDSQVDPRSINSSVVQKMLIYINQWTKNLNNVKFPNTHPVKKDSILSLYGIVSEVFSNIGIYSKAPPPAPPSPKDADSFSPLQTCPPPPLILIPLLLQQCHLLWLLVLLRVGSVQKKKKVVEYPGTSHNTIHAHADPPLLFLTCSI